MADSQQLEILRHSLGLTRSKEAYRNHFVTGPGSDDHPTCMALVEAGLMKRHQPSALTGGDDCFSVTEAGRAYVAEHTPPPPKLTRSQQRYRDYLRSDSDQSFREWLMARPRGVSGLGDQTFSQHTPMDSKG